jgi:hypothetical protein
MSKGIVSAWLASLLDHEVVVSVKSLSNLRLRLRCALKDERAALIPIIQLEIRLIKVSHKCYAGNYRLDA